jgi:hypothetical protein
MDLILSCAGRYGVRVFLPHNEETTKHTNSIRLGYNYSQIRTLGNVQKNEISAENECEM